MATPIPHSVSSSPIGPRLLGELLVDRALASAADIERGLQFQKQFGGRLGSVLVRMGVLSEDALLPVLADQLGLTVLVPADLPSTEAVTAAADLGRLGVDWLLNHEVLVFERNDGVMQAAARNPLDPFLQESLAAAFADRDVAWSFTRGQDLERVLAQLQATSKPVGDEIAHLKELAEEAPVIELCNSVLAQAVDQRASDIHVEPGAAEFMVRLRIDGVLYDRLQLPMNRFDAVASRFKLISGLDIAERRLPQDGRMTMKAAGAEMDVRVSVIPGVFGESIVMRLLPKERSNLTLEKLGLLPDHLALVRRWANEPHGIVLVTGPTGSGKSTTLHATLELANDRARKIITVEDPVEFKLSGITQIQAHAEIGYTFARALRAILRHDPDIIMIGEIRDRETADIAIQAALTGHMVFSTLHTNSALSTFGRLLDMGLEPFLIASSLRAVMAQRLARRLCPHCAAPATPPGWVVRALEPLGAMLRPLATRGLQWRQAVGCERCQGTGYTGRVGLYEVVEVTAAMHDAVVARSATHVIEGLVDRTTCRSLRDDGLIKAALGLTTVEEVVRVAGGAEAME